MTAESLERLSKYTYVGLLLGICILPFLVLSSFVQPQYDDFSVWAVLDSKSYLEAQIYWYNNWTGRYTAHALMGLFHPIVYRNISMLGFVSVVMQLAFLSSLFFIIRSVLPPKTSLLEVCLVFSTSLLLFIWQIPSPAEAFYWIPSVFSYQLGLILIFLFFGLLWRNISILSKRQLIILALLAFLIPGTCEINLLLFETLLFSTVAFHYIKTKSVPKSLLLLFGIALICSLFSILAPGNSARSGAIQSIEGAQPGNFGFTIITALKIIKGQLLPLFVKSPLLILSMLFLWFVSKLKWNANSNIQFWHLIVYKVIWIGLYFFLHLPFIFKAGIEYTPGRVLNLTQIIFIAGWLGYLTLIVNYFKVSKEKNFSLGFFFFTICILYIVVQLILPNKIQSAIRDYTSGNASNYKAIMERRYELFEKSKGEKLVVEPIENLPYTIFIADITDNPDEDRNKLVSLYFKLQSIKTDSTLSDN